MHRFTAEEALEARAACVAGLLAAGLGLRAALPLPAAAEPVTDGGEQRSVGVEERSERKQRSPDRRKAVEGDRREERGGQETPSQKRREPDPVLRSAGESDRDEESERKTRQSADELPGGIAQLGEGGAGDHVADFGEASVSAEAASGASEAHPDFASGTLDGAGQRTVVNDFAPD